MDSSSPDARGGFRYSSKGFDLKHLSIVHIYIYWAYWIAGFQASPYRLSGSEPAHCKRSCYHHGILVRGVLSFTLYTHIIVPQATPSSSNLEKVVDDSDEMAEAEKIATLEAERLRLLKVCLEMQVFQVVITPHSCR